MRYVSGDVIGEGGGVRVGGLIGYARSNLSSSSIANCHASVGVIREGENACVGGLVGSAFLILRSLPVIIVLLF
ncbi:MAG: hypothetical protein CSA81_14275 [Acidobacteria bacterium]|nr:MAG: hypothetical protein CSA81_14275 [Acidobacteriota bacterium]